MGALIWNVKAGKLPIWETFRDASNDIWSENRELLLQCLLDIQTWFMSPPDKCVCIPVPHLAEDLADYICEVCADGDGGGNHSLIWEGRHCCMHFPEQTCQIWICGKI